MEPFTEPFTDRVMSHSRIAHWGKGREGKGREERHPSIASNWVRTAPMDGRYAARFGGVR